MGGGAIYISGTGISLPSFFRCTFTQNVADSGGAIFVSTEGIVVEGCFFDSNSAVQNGGGRGGAMMSASLPPLKCNYPCRVQRKCSAGIEM